MRTILLLLLTFGVSIARGSIPPVPTSPSPGSTTSPGPTQSSSTVSLSWGASTGATYYDLGVVDVATGSFVVNTTTTSPSYSATLNPGKTYKWNVAAGNSSGESHFTTVIYFQTPAAVPATPTSPSPGSTTSPGPTQSSSTVSLSWGASTGATYYDLGVVDVATGSFVVNTTTTSPSYSATLDPGKTYKWNVAAGNSSGESLFTTVIYFQTPTTRLLAPSLSAPANGATGVSATPSFSWSQVSGNQGYRIIVSTVAADLPTDPTQAGGTPSDGFNQTVTQDTATYMWSGTLTAGATYYWEVHALGTSLAQAGDWSSQSDFTTASAITRLAAPTLTFPAGSATGVSTTPTFTWSQVSGNQGYRIIVSTVAADLPTDPTQAGGTPSDGFNQTVTQDTATYTWSGTLTAGATYYWEVHALGTSLAQAGNWSSQSDFTTASAITRLAAPTLTFPTGSATGVSTTPTFTWSQVSGNQGYRIIVSTVPNNLPTDPTQAGSTPSDGFNQTVAQSTTTYTWPANLTAAATYYWEVHALGTSLAQAGYWSGQSHFATATVVQPPNGNLVAGFDEEFFPAHESTMSDIIHKTNLRWCGYYLSGPSQRLDTGWLGERAYLQTLGWQLAPIYVGQQDPAYPVPDLSKSPSSQQGTADGSEAVTEMGPDTGQTETVYAYDAATQKFDIPKTVVQGQGFSPGMVVYLDIEYGDLSTAPNVTQDEAYILAWCKAVSNGGYTPGIYCPYTDAATIQQLLQQNSVNAVIWAAHPGYAVASGLLNLPTPDPLNSGYANATSWQYADGYTIQTINGPYVVDLDSSSQYANVSQPVLNVGATSLGLPASSPGIAGVPTSFVISGSGLGISDNVTVSAPTGGEVSQKQASGFATAVVLQPDSGGNLAATVIYARISAAATANVSGTLTVADASNSGLNQSIQISGNDNSGNGDQIPPTLSVIYPGQNSIVASSTLVINGTASDNGNGDNGITVVTVNGIAANNGTASGANTATWNATVILNLGPNTINVSATDGAGNVSQDQLVVTYSPNDSGAAPPVLSNFQLTGTTFNVSVPTQPGFNYILEYKRTMTDENWIPVQTNNGSGGSIILSDPTATDPGRFYRVLVQ